MSKIFSKVSALLNAKRMVHHASEELGLIQMPYQGAAGEWNVIIKMDEARGQVAVYSLLPMKALPAVLSRVSEFIQRVNWGLVLGNFELDLNDGDIRFKVSMAVTEEELSEEAIEELLHVNTETVERCLEPLTQVLLQRVEPKDAARFIQSV